MPISVAFVETAHFSFHGLGDTPQQAIDAVMRAWAHHVRLTGAHPRPRHPRRRRRHHR